MSNKFDTAELNDIRKLLGEDVPAPKSPVKPEPSAAPQAQDSRNSGGGRTFNLDDILAEVSGVVDEANAEHAAHTTTPPQFAGGAKQQAARPAAARPAAAPQNAMPRSASGMQQQEIRVQRRSAQQQAPSGAQAAQQAPQGAPQSAPQEAPVRAQRPAQQQPQKGASRRARMRDQDDDDIEILDPTQAMVMNNRRSKNLGRRSIPVLILGLIALYLTIAESLALPMPSLISFSTNPRLFMLAQVGFQIICMLIGIDVIGSGFYNLVTGKADRASLVALANMATILHCMSFIICGWAGVLPYSSICILLLYAAIREEKNRCAGRARAYKAVTLHETPMGVYYHHDGTDHARRTVKSRMSDRTDFQRELESPDATERFAKVYAPIMLIASIVLSVVVSLVRQDISYFFWNLSAMLTIVSPLPILCAFGRAYYNVSRRLLSEGAALAGGQAAFRVRKARRAVIQDSDLFPGGTVTISEVRAHSGYTPEKLLSYAVAVTDGYDMEIGKLLAEALREQYGRPARATNIKVYDMGGLSGEIGADTVLVGTAAYMARMGMPVQEPKKGRDVETGVYVVINGQPAGVIQLTYHSNAQTFSALQALIRLKVMPELATRDFNISPEMVQKMFETRRGRIGEVASDRVAAVTSSAYTMGDRVCAILSRDGIVPFAQVHQSADKLSGAMRSNLILGAVGGVCGLLLMFYLAFTGHPEAVTPKNVLFYLILWYIPSFFVTFHTRKGL